MWSGVGEPGILLEPAPARLRQAELVEGIVMGGISG